MRHARVKCGLDVRISRDGRMSGSGAEQGAGTGQIYKGTGHEQGKETHDIDVVVRHKRLEVFCNKLSVPELCNIILKPTSRVTDQTFNRACADEGGTTNGRSSTHLLSGETPNTSRLPASSSLRIAPAPSALPVDRHKEYISYALT